MFGAGQIRMGVETTSCGNFLPVLRPLCATPGVKGINASQLTITQLINGGLDPTKTLIASTNLSELPEIMREVRRHDLHPCLTINGFYPHQDGAVKTNLSAAERAELQARSENVHNMVPIDKTLPFSAKDATPMLITRDTATITLRSGQRVERIDRDVWIGRKETGR